MSMSDMLERTEAPTQPGSSDGKQREVADLLAFALREMTSEWFYDLELNGAEIEGIGVQGAMELAGFRAEQGYPIRLLNGMDLVEVSRNGSLGIQATLVAREARTSREGVGVAFFPYWTELSSAGADEAAERQVVEDTRADRKALSIAKRNAILDLIPDHVKQTILAERARAVPLNEARKANELIAARARHAVPVRTTTPEQLRREADIGPYDQPSTLQSRSAIGGMPAPATPRQIVALARLIVHPSVSETVRHNVNQHLETGLSEALATEWIQILEAQVKDKG